MTTGLQTAEQTTTRPRPGRALAETVGRGAIATAARFLAALRAPSRHTYTSVAPPRPGREVALRAHGGGAPDRARDLHDRAVLRGVVPPRL